MTKVDIFSGFLGAGKTTLIKKLISEAYKGMKIVIIENEFGQIGIDGGFLKDSGIQVTEMNSGCICCSLVGDFGVALAEVIKQYNPDRILIEPSGVGKLSDVTAAVKRCEGTDIAGITTVIDVKKLKMYLKNFKEFYENQIHFAGTIVLSRTDSVSQEKLDEAVALIREINAEAQIITTPWDQLSGKQILDSIENPLTAEEMAKSLLEEAEAAAREHEHHHHHHDGDDDDDECDDPNCSCHHHHDDDDDDDDDHDHHCCHHHHDDDDDDDDHDHHCCHHHHDDDDDECDDPNCSCHHHHDDDDDDDDDHDHHCCHHHHDDDDDDDDHDHEHEHHHHHHHHADEVFDSVGYETSKKFTIDEISEALTKLDDAETYGIILRAKGIVAGEDGQWIHFDYVPEEKNVRNGTSDVTGKLCIIGSDVKHDAVKALFGIA